MRRKPSAKLLFSVITAMLLAALALLWLVFNNSHWNKPRPLRPDFSEALDNLGTPTALQRSEFVILSQASLFEADRKAPPPEPAKATEAPPPQAPPEDRLDKATILGIYGASPNGGIILRIDEKEQRLRINENIDGWTLQSIDGRTIKFKSDKGNEREMILEHKIPAPPTNNAQPPRNRRAAPQNQR